MVKIGKQCAESNFTAQSSLLLPYINAKCLIRENFISVVDHLSTRC